MLLPGLGSTWSEFDSVLPLLAGRYDVLALAGVVGLDAEADHQRVDQARRGLSRSSSVRSVATKPSTPCSDVM